MLERVLVPLDGSPTAEAILPHLRRLLYRRDMELLLLRVADPPGGELPMTAVEASLAAARGYIVGIKDRLVSQGIRATADTSVGPAAGTILDLAKERGVTLIAMASHGRTALPRVVLGSVAEQVLRKSPIPVYVVRPFGKGQDLPAGRNENEPIQNILVPTDLSEFSAAVLEPAIQLAKLFECRLVFFHATDPAGEGPGEAAAKEALGDLARRAAREGVAALEVVDRGEAAEAILENARFHGCDLIAMTTHGRSGLSRLVLGSVTENVLRGGVYPLLVVRGAKKSRSPAEKAGARAKR